MLLYEIKVAYVRQTGEDNPGKVKESYLVEGINPSDVEKRLLEKLAPYMFGDFEIERVIKRKIYDIIPSSENDRWYKAKVEMITVEDDGHETRNAVTILVQGLRIETALRDLQKYLASLDCEVVNIALSPILEIYRANNA